MGWSQRFLLAVSLLVFGGCARKTSTHVTVFAASSLTDVFLDLEKEFERGNPDVDLRLGFAGSQVLRLQLEQGAQAELFASAAESHAVALFQSGWGKAPQVLAHNRLTLIVPQNSSARDFRELAGRRIVVGSPGVPARAATEVFLERLTSAGEAALAAQLRRSFVSEESNVRLIRAKVELGEADAGFVYVTDVNPRVRAVDLPQAPRTTVLLVATSKLAAGSVADEFQSMLAGAPGRDAFRRRGFELP